ncbi:hypothetical protein GR183_08930 [Stappia sp. GBMRC 2046]|uniref:Uncharacterized protein n=1 Tax=Stappia sediminis TaxID=2692190 RepID=A0A7X3LTX5_9HYPH|nr:hypothetical protein [Stappia sediminis]MXN65028.1 hypothetical protein [Stappia sediminis]
MILAVFSRTIHPAHNSLGVLLAAGWGYILVLVAVNPAINMALAPDGGFASQFRSALFPTGMRVIVTWIFASPHATSYASVRERFAEEVGFSADDVKRAQALRTIEMANRLGRDSG